MMLTVAVNAVALYLGALYLERSGAVAGVAIFLVTAFTGTVVCSFVEHQLKEIMLGRLLFQPIPRSSGKNRINHRRLQR